VEFDRKKGMLVKVDGEERAKESKLRRIGTGKKNWAIALNPFPF